MNFIVDRVVDGQQKSSVTMRNLHIEPDIINTIFSNLNLVDRLNLALTCKDLENFHNIWPEFWNNVWIDASKAEVTHNMTRNYDNIILRIDFDPWTPSPFDVLAPFVSTMKSLHILCKEIPEIPLDDDEDENQIRRKIVHPRRLIKALPLFANLISLDLSDIGVILDFRNVVSSASPRVVMMNLQHLKINICLLAGLRSYMDLSDIKGLKTIDVTLSEYYVVEGVSNDEIDAAQNDVFALIRQQQGLENLVLDFGHSMDLFDQPLAMESQLEKFVMYDASGNSFSTLYKQDNLAVFLESQDNLKLSLYIQRDNDSRISSKLLYYVARTLRICQKAQSIHVHGFAGVCLDIFTGDCYQFMAGELHRVFLSQTVQSNNSTVRLHIWMYKVKSHKWLISGLCSLYPCLEELSIESSLTFLTNLKSLGSLNHLQSLNLRACQISSSLRDVEIPSLKRFSFSVINGQMKHGASWELKKFLGRHKKLNRVELVLAQFHDEKSRKYSKHSCQIFSKDSSDLIKFILENLLELETLKAVGVDFISLVNERSESSPCIISIRDHPNPELTVMLLQANYKEVDEPIEAEKIGVEINKTLGVVNWSYITKNDKFN